MRRSTFLLGAIAAMLLCGSSSAAAATDDARITAEEVVSPRVIELTISTSTFTEPTHVNVDLPTGYDDVPDRRWPVTYVLAGTMNTYKTFNEFVDGVELTKSYPSIIVSPNGDSGYWSDWYNAGAFGPPQYETYVIDQLIPLIDARFRTIPRRSQRAVLGISMGGYGSMMFAARHPDLFAAAATLSGAVDSNLPTLGAALTASPEFQGGQPDAINGPRATQEVRWHGRNPTDLAANLGGLDLQVRSANGVPNPGIGEDPTSADSVSCVIEGGVYMGSVSLHDTLTALNIPHLWKDYGPGCHTVANFRRELTDTFDVFAKDFAHPSPPPPSFDYKSIEPAFDVWGWRFRADADRALEFMQLNDVGDRGLTIGGSGMTSVTTPPMFRGVKRVDIVNAEPAAAMPDSAGRLSFTVDLGAPDAQQQYTPGATTTVTSRSVHFEPHAVVRVTRLHATRHRVRVCARALGGAVTGRMRLIAGHKRAATRGAKITLKSNVTCRSLRRTRRAIDRAKLLITGHDEFAHHVSRHRKVRLPVAHKR